MDIFFALFLVKKIPHWCLRTRRGGGGQGNFDNVQIEADFSYTLEGVRVRM